MSDPIKPYAAGECAPASIARDLGDQYQRLFDETIIVDKNERQIAIVLPTGRHIESLKPLLDEYLEKPERRKGTITALNADSFIRLVQRYSGGDTVIFADPNDSAPKLTAVFDYTPEGAEAKDTAWLGHRAMYAPALSKEWLAWKANDGKFLSVPDFAAFIENRIMDIAGGEATENQRRYADLVKSSFAQPSDMITLSRGLEINLGGKVKNAFKNQSGELAVQFEQAHNPSGADGKPLSVPGLFSLAIPVFFGGELYRLTVALRYRVDGNGTITWAYQMWRPDLAFKSALDEMLLHVERDLGDIPVYQGAPER